jgi:hypothetical protein
MKQRDTDKMRTNNERKERTRTAEEMTGRGSNDFVEYMDFVPANAPVFEED